MPPGSSLVFFTNFQAFTRSFLCRNLYSSIRFQIVKTSDHVVNSHFSVPNESTLLQGHWEALLGKELIQIQISNVKFESCALQDAKASACVILQLYITMQLD